MTWYEREIAQCPFPTDSAEYGDYCESVAMMDIDLLPWEKQDMYQKEQEEYLADHGKPMPLPKPTFCMNAELPPEAYDVRNYSTLDIQHDLAMMITGFGDDDPDVKEYRDELDRRNEPYVA